MSSDCPLKGEQCTNRFQIQAILGLHSFGSNSAVISSLVSEMYDRWRGNMGVPSGDSTTPLIKSRFYHQRKQDLEPHMYCKEKLKHSRFIQFPGNIKTSYSTCRIYPSSGPKSGSNVPSSAWSKSSSSSSALSKSSSSSSTPSSSSILTCRARSCESCGIRTQVP